DVLIGIRATVLSGALIGHGSLIGAGALVPEGMVVPPHSLVLGLPAKIVRPVSSEQAAMIRRIAQSYVKSSRAHLAGRSAPSPQVTLA
ncbi:MAG: gamma carbonic anhydrase family protein, partial [Anaerolineae bacterium]